MSGPNGNSRFEDFRCKTATPDGKVSYCNRLLFSGRLDGRSKIRIRCPACGTMHQFEKPLDGTLTHAIMQPTTEPPGQSS